MLCSERRQTAVTISQSFNVYVYEPRNLYIAYGTALGCALLCTLVGLYSMLANNAAYSNVFSTVVRTTRRLDLGNHIHPGDLGADPLPKALAAAEIDLVAKDGWKKV